MVITPETIHVLLEHIHDSRRIYTDGRDWPKSATPTLQGYSIGKWVDTDGDGRFDTLEVETRNMRGPRAFDASGMPLHKDNKTIVKEKISLDKSNPNIMLNEMTTIDSSLTPHDGGTRMTVEIVCNSAEHLERYIQLGVARGTARTCDNLVAFVGQAHRND